MISRKRFLLSTFMAWLIYIMIDFIIHAAIIKNLWEEEQEAIKSLKELAVLIPVGYTSFLFLTLLVGWLYTRLFKDNINRKSALVFGFQFGGLYFLANFLGMYSYLDLPMINVIAVNFSYYIEIAAVCLVYAYLIPLEKIKKRVIFLVVLFFVGIILGIIIQNIINNFAAG